MRKRYYRTLCPISLFITVLLLNLCIAGASVADDADTGSYSVIFPSFVHHFYPTGNDLTENFDNWFFAVTRRSTLIPGMDAIVVGTLRNSSNNQCLLLGAIKDWGTISARTKFKGMYAYVGEFIGDSFSHCGDDGLYEDIKNAVGVGFAPYLYHGLEYQISSALFLNGGLVLPGVATFTLELKW